MFIAKGQSGYGLCFGPGHKPLRTEASGDALINIFAQKDIRQSSWPMPARLKDSSMRGGPGEKSTDVNSVRKKSIKVQQQQTKH